MSEYANTSNDEIGWDDVIMIGPRRDFILLEPGDYDFTVSRLERGRFPGSENTPPCNQVTVYLEIETDDGTATIRDNLIMRKNFKWKLENFLVSIGQAERPKNPKEEIPLHPRWTELPGLRGRAKIIVREYTKKDGTPGKSNEVKTYYDYDPSQHRTTFTEIPSNDKSWGEVPF